ncbi:hypothetical protein [Cellulomonas timonensis]|uniref:hypothetical protein n=1 Tax=Cellulomonas timonensis TaxID=1689271 RepID=UPI000AED333A|nr:hypothetical protein [Cellulomonas timonensis]
MTRSLVARARAHGRGEDGLATSAVLVVVAVGVVALLFLAVLPLLQGTDQAGRTQTAADAAALAGAEEVRKVALDHVGDVVLGATTYGSLLGPARGHTQASDYATRNGGELVGYAQDPWRDEVEVRTWLREQMPDGQRAERDAVAALGVALARCAGDSRDVVVGYEPVPTPEPTDPEATPDPDDPDEPEEEPEPVPIIESEHRFTCPGYDSGWTRPRAALEGPVRSWLTSALEPHLVR